jgi:hypothetical protein
MAKIDAEAAEVQDIVSSAMSVAPKFKAPIKAASSLKAAHETSIELVKAPMDEFEPLTKVEGLDVQEGLKRFSGDKEVYLGVIKSYAQSVNDLMDQLTDPDLDDLKNYIITIHGIKSSSYGICAKGVGKMAENLEHRASDGDVDYVKTYNPQFLTAVTRLTESLMGILNENEAQDNRPLKDRPDPSLIKRLKDACASYDMDGIDRAFSELDLFMYANEPDLTPWLKDKIDQMDFKQILDRLSLVA